MQSRPDAFKAIIVSQIADPGGGGGGGGGGVGRGGGSPILSWRLITKYLL